MKNKLRTDLKKDLHLRIDEEGRIWCKTDDIGLPGYEISTCGELMSYKQSKKGRILGKGLNGGGYVQTKVVHSDGVRRKTLRHRIVALTFLENPHNKPTVNHRNEIKTDNRLENLEWSTKQEQQDHSNSKAIIGTCMTTGKEIRFKSIQEAGRNGFNYGTVGACCRGIRKSHQGYIWKYE